jgi:hypothetical protein
VALSLDDSIVRDDLRQLLADTAPSSLAAHTASSSRSDNLSGLADTDDQEARSRREFIWVGMDAEPDIQLLFSAPLRKIQQQFKKAIDRHKLTKRVMRRLRSSNDQSLSVHRCTSYLKEEVILGTTLANSAILLSSSPSIHEVCFVCGRRVTAQEEEEDKSTFRSYCHICEDSFDIEFKEPPDVFTHCPMCGSTLDIGFRDPLFDNISDEEDIVEESSQGSDSGRLVGGLEGEDENLNKLTIPEDVAEPGAPLAGFYRVSSPVDAAELGRRLDGLSSEMRTSTSCIHMFLASYPQICSSGYY